MVDFECLSEDYSKIVFLLDDRNVELHARYGYHYRTRIPRAGRTLVYHAPSCDVFLAGASPEIYRLNLDQGRFMKSLVTSASSINTSALNPLHGLLAVGTADGTVECFDPRDKRAVGQLPVRGPAGGNAEVSALSFFTDGLRMAVGTSDGHVLLYDVRSSVPMLKKEHSYGLPIKAIQEHRISGNVFSCDAKVVKIWNGGTGAAVTTMEVGEDINGLCLCPDSGLFFLANEGAKIMSFFIPLLGPAPRWCAHLDSLTEELDEEPASVYDDYKFVTRQELEDLGMEHLIGTNLLRAYMHGFFMDVKLYRKIKEIAEPFAYEEYRKEKIRKRVEEASADRLRLPKKKLPAVNTELAKKLIAKAKVSDAAGAAAAAPALMQDARFSAMFSNPDFEIDTESLQYKLLHPADPRTRRSDLLAEATALAQEDSEPEGRGSDDEDSDEEEEEEEEDAAEKAPTKRAPAPAPARARVSATAARPQASAKRQFTVSSADDVKDFAAADAARDLALPLEQRLAHLSQNEIRQSHSAGSMTISFAVKRNKPAAADEATARKDRRGVKELRLPKESTKKYWRGRLVRN